MTMPAPGSSCGWNPLCGGSSIFHGLVGSAASSTIPAGWDAVCLGFAASAEWLLSAFMAAYAKIQDVSLSSAGIADSFGISLVIGSAVAALLVFGQVIRTLWTHDGSGMAQALVGVAKAVLAWLATAAVATAGIAAADSMTQFIVSASHDAQAGLVVKVGALLNAVQDPSAQGAAGVTVLLVFGLIVIALVIVLWFELLLRNAALAVLIAVSPIAAAGQVSEGTKVWWSRTVSAAVQLIILKPIIALVFAVGFGMVGQSAGISALIEGLLVLGLAAFAWPVIARFFTFSSVMASSGGLSTVLGFAAGRLSAGSGQASGVHPAMFSRSAEGRVMGGGAGAGAGAPGGAPTGGGGGATVVAGIGWALQTAHQVGSALSGRMEQTAASAGMPGAYPYSTVGGGRLAPHGQGSGPGRTPTRPSAPADSAGAGAQPPPVPGPPPGRDTGGSSGNPGWPDDDLGEF
jgi:hypothetical protein